MSKNDHTRATEVDEEDRSMAVPFFIGAVVGGIAGAVLAATLGRQTADAVGALASAIDRRTNRDGSDRPRFELLLQ